MTLNNPRADRLKNITKPKFKAYIIYISKEYSWHLYIININIQSAILSKKMSKWRAELLRFSRYSITSQNNYSQKFSENEKKVRKISHYTNQIFLIRLAHVLRFRIMNRVGRMPFVDYFQTLLYIYIYIYIYI